MTSPVLISTIQNIKSPSKPALHRLTDPEKGTWVPETYGEFREHVMAIAATLIDLGLEVQKPVGILSENRPELIETSFAAWQARAMTVGIYATASADQVKYIVDNAGIEIMLVGSQKHYDIARAIGMKQIIAVDPTIALDEADTSPLRYEQALARGAEVADAVRARLAGRTAETCGDDLATLLYTSGTTGQPKGAMLTHNCFTTAMDIHRRRLTLLSDADTSLCFLPLTHVF